MTSCTNGALETVRFREGLGFWPTLFANFHLPWPEDTPFPGIKLISGYYLMLPGFIAVQKEVEQCLLK